MVNATPRPLYPRERDQLPIVQEAAWAPGRFWTGAENLPPELDPRTVQPVARSIGWNRIGVCWIYPSLNKDKWRAVLKNVTIFRIL